MKALILVGGKATRLRPLTINTPKALVPVLNTPFLEYVINNLVSIGIKDIVLALGHLHQPIMEHFADGGRFGANIRYSREDTLLLSAGAAKQAEKYLDETFLVFNGDNFIDLDFRAMATIHQNNHAKVTIALTRVDNPTQFGLVETEADGKVRRFLEKPKPEQVTTNTVNAGAWLVEPEVLSMVPPGMPCSFERDIFPSLLSKREPVYSYTSEGYWMDAGTMEKYLQLHRDLLDGKSRQYKPAKGLQIGKKTRINPKAIITGQVVIGDNCYVGAQAQLNGPVTIGNGCTILRDCFLENAVLWNNVRLEQGVRLKDSVAANACHLKARSGGEKISLGDTVTLEKGVIVECGSEIIPGTSVNA